MWNRTYFHLTKREKKIHYECNKCKLNFILKADLDSWKEFENFYDLLIKIDICISQ